MNEYQFKSKSQLKDPRFFRILSNGAIAGSIKSFPKNKRIWIRKPEAETPYFETPKKRIMTK